MINLLMTIDRRTRYLDRAFPKSDEQLLDEAIERELGRYPEADREAIIAETLAGMQTEFPQYAFPSAGAMLRQSAVKGYGQNKQLKQSLGPHRATFEHRFVSKETDRTDT